MKFLLVRLLFLLMFGFPGNTNSQITPPTYNIIPPSPNAASLAKFGDIPVSNYTGIPSIDIPIYTIATGDLKLNISLSYHAGGIKVDEIASNAGLGWALNFGGMISRTVRGIPDESQHGYLNNGIDIANIPNLPINELGIKFNQVNQNLTDLQPDVYNCNFFGRSGKFILDRNTRKGYMSNHNDMLVIQWNPDRSWTITDGAGNKFFFGLYNSNFAAEHSIVTQNGRTNVASVHAASSWLLLRAMDANGNSIQFNYIDYTTTYCIANQEVSTTLDYTVGVPEDGCNSFDMSSKSWYENEILGKKISSIIWDGGEVSFKYSSIPRTDITTTDNRLESITVFNNLPTSNQVSEFILSHSYFGNESTSDQSVCTNNYSTGKLKLDRIQQIGNDDQALLPPYEFTYTPGGVPAINSMSQDHWGYYNGAFNSTMVPEMIRISGASGEQVTYEGAYRSPNFLAMKKGALTEIKYPTGGKTLLEYECNDVFRKKFPFEKYNDGIPLIEYARVAKSYMTGNLPYNEATFTVNGPFDETLNKSGFFIKIFVSVNNCDPSVRLGGCGGTVYIQPAPNTTGSGWQFGSASGPVGGTLVYDVFIENGTYQLILEGDNSITSLNINSCRIKGPDPSLIAPDGRYNKKIGGLRIKKITTVDGSGKTIIENYKYRKETDTNQSSGVLVSTPVYSYWTTVLGTPNNGIINTCILFNTVSTSKAPLSTTQGSHVGYSFVEISKGELEFPARTGKSAYTYTTAENYRDGTSSNSFPFPPATSYDHRRGLLLNTKNYKNDNGIYKIVSEDIYNYTLPDQRHSKANEGAVIGSRGLNSYGHIMLETRSFEDVSEWVWMREKKSRVYSVDNANAYSEITTKYFYDNLQHLQLTKTESTKSDNTQENTFFKYPHDFAALPPYNEMIVRNMVSPVVQKETYNVTKLLYTLKTNYDFWHNNSLIKPKTIQTGIGANTLNTETTINSYDSRGNILQLTGKDGVTASYVWGYKSQYPVAKIVNAGYSTVQLYITQSTLDNAIGGSDDMAIRNHLNNLRSITGAFVTTYTYKPLVGMTSETDANNRTTYYEYDVFNRLSIVRDQDNNILKKICYNYANQQVDCFGNSTAAQWLSTGAVRCKSCPANTNYITSMQQHEERDANTYSSTYGTLRWVDDNTAGNCTGIANWQNVDAPVCQKTTGNLNTGYQLQTQRDLNPCSPTYNTTRIAVTGYNPTLCPLPPPCSSSNCSGNDKKCINGVCETGVYVFEEISGTLTNCREYYHYEWSDGSWSPTYSIRVPGRECGSGGGRD